MKSLVSLFSPAVNIGMVMLESGLPHPDFAFYPPESLDSLDLGEACTQALYANISTCPSDVQDSFTRRSYRGPPSSKAMADAICTDTCQASLASWVNSVSSACAGKTLDGAEPTRTGATALQAWKETCLREPGGGKYCHEVIANFTTVNSFTQMPRNELCSACYVRILALMQSSPYSVYNDFYMRNLEYVHAQCGGSGPTEILTPLGTSTQRPSQPSYCPTKRYTTTAGDTCDSIAAASKVSAAALYMTNQELVRDCAKVPAGLSLCLPFECVTYQLEPEDTCISVEMKLQLAIHSLAFYNTWINEDCSSLQPATDWYGKTICVSPQGGLHTGTAKSPEPTASGYSSGPGGPGSGTGPGGDQGHLIPVAPPVGAPVAEGTTLGCGKWHVVTTGENCAIICVEQGITYNVLVQVNPSLATDCSASLRPGTSVCVGPIPGWASYQPPAAFNRLEESSTSPTSRTESRLTATSTRR